MLSCTNKFIYSLHSFVPQRFMYIIFTDFKHYQKLFFAVWKCIYKSGFKTTGSYYWTFCFSNSEECFLFTQCRRLLEKFCAINSIKKCLSCECEMEGNQDRGRNAGRSFWKKYAVLWILTRVKVHQKAVFFFFLYIRHCWYSSKYCPVTVIPIC